MTPDASDLAEIETRILYLEEELTTLKAKMEELLHNQATDNELIPTVTTLTPLTPQQRVMNAPRNRAGENIRNVSNMNG